MTKKEKAILAARTAATPTATPPPVPTPDPALTAFPVAPAVPAPVSTPTPEQIADAQKTLDDAPVPEAAPFTPPAAPPPTAEELATAARGAGIKTIASDEPLSDEQLAEMGFISDATREEGAAGRNALIAAGHVPGTALPAPVLTSEQAASQPNVATNFGGRIPESTALEQQAGREALARKHADYATALKNNAEAAAKKLHEGAAAEPSDLHYPKR